MHFLKDRPEFEEIVKYSNTLETPHVIVDKELIRTYFKNMKQACNFADIYFALKACPMDEVAKMLVEEGSNFDIASRYELDQILALGASPEKVFYGNTIKKEKDIEYFYSKGVRTFASDCENDIRKIAKVAKGSNVYFRLLLPETTSADWPLSKKFGTSEDIVLDLIPLAKELGLNPIGVSFHVGSQQKDLNVWDIALSMAARIFAKSPVKLSFIDMGGGFPAHYQYQVKTVVEYAQIIKSFIDKYFPTEKPRFVMEPGRSLAGDSGVLAATVIEVEKKHKDDNFRWVYLDAGKFNGLVETIDESIKYPVICSNDMGCKKATGPCVLAGPTCDSLDIMYENEKYLLPLDLKAGDRIYFLATGAYTTSYASVNFNGFPPIKGYVWNRK